MESEEQAFRRKVLEMAQTLGKISAREVSYSSPKDIHSDLCKIDKVLTTALQVLLPLDLIHDDGLDLESLPFNWPVVQELNSARNTTEILRVKGLPAEGFRQSNFPSKALAGMVELRDAARMAAQSCKPRRGNSSRRSARSFLVNQLGTGLVFWFRARFGHMPPVTKTGWIVDLMQEALDAAGVSNADASQVLREAIKRDTVGRESVPSAKSAKAIRRRIK